MQNTHISKTTARMPPIEPNRKSAARLSERTSKPDFARMRNDRTLFDNTHTMNASNCSVRVCAMNPGFWL